MISPLADVDCFSIGSFLDRRFTSTPSLQRNCRRLAPPYVLALSSLSDEWRPVGPWLHDYSTSIPRAVPRPYGMVLCELVSGALLYGFRDPESFAHVFDSAVTIHIFLHHEMTVMS